MWCLGVRCWTGRTKLQLDLPVSPEAPVNLDSLVRLGWLDWRAPTDRKRVRERSNESPLTNKMTAHERH